jgi:hypothetical protein
MPPIPVRTEVGLTHPIGIVETNVAGTELKYAVENCGVKVMSLDWGVCFEASNLPFKEFVADIYGKRLRAKKNANSALSELFKLIMNSAYGGFAMHAPVFLCGIVEASHVEYLEKPPRGGARSYSGRQISSCFI